MENNLYEETIPSEKISLLKLLEGQKIDKMVRYSWLKGDEAVEEYGIKSNDVFSLTAGPILLYFQSGMIIGASSDPSQNSVVLWVEKDGHGYVTNELIEEDAELYSINSKDIVYSSTFWSQLEGQQIKKISIIRCKPKNAKFASLPNEVGLLLTMSNGVSFILSHGLHDNSDDFSVITENDIDKRLVEDLNIKNE